MTEATAIEIRPATVADADVVARIHVTSRVASMPFLPPPKRTHEQVTRWVEEVLLTECRTWVAVRGGEVLGYAAVEGSWLEHLYLRPDVRRQGIGTYLLNEAKWHSAGALSLHVFEQNTDARAFYERHGFTVLSVSDGSENMEKLPDLTMGWTLEGVAE
ncbi:GNAT family N-acetyltransferase [Kitasatospora nipponensis]|uniref:GNAT family N-acetyltransferase n=1 Tax=Kitasatospora nipponensis TaxID=258049 RepID=A0ABN1WBC8_9ACTN